MRSSACIGGASQVGFSATIWKINSRTSFGVRLLPTCVRTPEINLQYIREPVRCQRTTVSGVTTMRACFHPDQNRRTTTQKSLSSGPMLGRRCRRFSTASCCRSTRFSNTRFPRLRKRRISAPIQRRSRLNMAWSYTRSNDWKYCCKLLILRSARVLAKDSASSCQESTAGNAQCPHTQLLKTTARCWFALEWIENDLRHDEILIESRKARPSQTTASEV